MKHMPGTYRSFERRRTDHLNAVEITITIKVGSCYADHWPAARRDAGQRSEDKACAKARR